MPNDLSDPYYIGVSWHFNSIFDMLFDGLFGGYALALHSMHCSYHRALIVSLFISQGDIGIIEQLHTADRRLWSRSSTWYNITVSRALYSCIADGRVSRGRCLPALPRPGARRAGWFEQGRGIQTRPEQSRGRRVRLSTYEIVSIVRPDFDEDALNAAIERIHQRITENGGTVKSTDRWGKRRIAYPIQNYRDGFYVLTVFDLDSGRVGPLRQTLGLHEGLLRFTVSTHRVSQAPAAATPTQGAPAAAPTAPATASPAAPVATTATAAPVTPSPTKEEPPSGSPSGAGHV